MKFSDISWRTVLFGLVISAGVFIGVRYVFGQIWDPVIRTYIILAGAPLGTLAAGYYISRQPVHQASLHVILAVVLDAVLLILLRMLPANLLLLGIMLLTALLGMFLGQRMPISVAGTPFSTGGSYSSRGYPTSGPAIQLPSWSWRLLAPFQRMINNRKASQLYDELLRRSRMDRDLADRLIDFERRRTPYASRLTLVRNALERLDRDNR